MKKIPQLTILALFVFVITGGAQTPPPPPPPPPAGVPGGIHSAPVASWQEFNNEAGNFAATLPGKPMEMNQTVETEIGKVPIRMFVVQDSGIAYMVMYAEYPIAMDTPDAIKTSLDNARDMMLSSRNGKLVSEKEISFGKFAGRELRAKITGGMMRLRTYIVQQRLYALMALSLQGGDAKPLEAKEVNSFLDSFRLLKEPQAPAGAASMAQVESAIEKMEVPPDFHTRPVSWREVASPEFGFTVWMPSEPHRQTIPLNPNDRRLDIQMWMAKGEEVICQVMAQPMLAAPRDEDHRKILFKNLLDGILTEGKMKLLSEKQISFEGHPGREYKLRMPFGVATGKAYIFGHNICMLIAFPFGGNEKSGEIARFFDSFRLTKTPDGGPRAGAPSAESSLWREFSAPERGYKVLLPGEPKQESENSDGIKHHMVISAGDGLMCLVAHQQFTANLEGQSTLDAFFKSFIDGFAKSAKIEVAGETKITFEGHQGREYKLKRDSVTGIARAYIIGNESYALVVFPMLPEVDPKSFTRFFDSFKLIEKPSKPDSDEPPPPPPPPPPAPVSSTATQSPKPTNVSGGVLQGSAIKKVQPEYPPIAKASLAQGAVQVQVTISEKGRVIDAQVIDGHPLLRDAALEAAKQWQFKPTLLEGRPVKVMGILTFNFVLQ